MAEILEIFIAAVPGLVAGLVAISRVTDNKIDDKVARLIDGEGPAIQKALKRLLKK